MYHPELPINPPEAKHIIADCGCECANGDSPILSDGRWLCAECANEEFNGLPVEEKASAFGCYIGRVVDGRIV